MDLSECYDFFLIQVKLAKVNTDFNLALLNWHIFPNI